LRECFFLLCTSTEPSGEYFFLLCTSTEPLREFSGNLGRLLIRLPPIRYR
jgi:hypothetical protein